MIYLSSEYGNTLGFKDESLYHEFQSETLDKNLREAILPGVGRYAWEKHGIIIVVTAVFDNGKRPVSNSHKTGHAVDWRGKTYAADIICDLINFINSHYPRRQIVETGGVTYCARAAVGHGFGEVFHVHTSADY